MADESLILGGVALHEAPFTLEGLTYTPPEKKRRWAENADSDGEALVEESHYKNSLFALRIRIEPQASMNTALEKLGELIDALQECERLEGGAELDWLPAGATTTYTAYAISADLGDLPTEVTGENAGWFIRSPVATTIQLHCRPFLRTPERVVLEATEGEGPLQEFYIPEVGGDMPAEGRLVLTDKVEGGQARRYVDWGLEQVESEEGNPQLLFEADEDLVVEGYAGELAELEGSHSTEVVEASLVTQLVALCSTGNIAHVGSYRLPVRVQVDGEGALFRASYRTSDGPWTPLPWVEPPLQNEWVEIDLGEALLEEVAKGAQISEIRIESKVEETGRTGYVDLLATMPTKRYASARAPLTLDVPTTLLVSDAFNQAEGNATGKSAELGDGVYAAVTNSDTTDFTISGGKLKRTAVSDTGTIGSGGHFTGRGIGTSTKFTDLAIQHSFTVSNVAVDGGISGLALGHIVSYVNNENFVMILIHPDWPSFSGVGPGPLGMYARVYRADGTLLIDEVLMPGYYSGTLLTVVKGETLSFYFDGEQQLVVSDPLIGAEGKAYIYDQQASGFATTREYDNCAIWEPDQPVVCHPSQSVEFRHDTAEREDEGGTHWAPVPNNRGSHFLLPPAGDSEQIARLAVRMRRNDNKLESDAGLTDKQEIEVLARERFLAPR